MPLLPSICHRYLLCSLFALYYVRGTYCLPCTNLFCSQVVLILSCMQTYGNPLFVAVSNYSTWLVALYEYRDTTTIANADSAR